MTDAPAMRAAGAGFATGLAVTGTLLVDVARRWSTHYALHPFPGTGMSAGTLARHPPDFLASGQAQLVAFCLAGAGAFLLALGFPRRQVAAVFGLWLGSCLAVAVALACTPGQLSSSLGPLAVLVNLVFAGGLLGVAALAGALPAAGINAVGRWFRRHRDRNRP